MPSTEILKSEVRKLLHGKNSAILELGEFSVLITVINNADDYDLDGDLKDPEIANIVAEGYRDYLAGRLVDHEEVLRRLKWYHEKD